MPRGPALPRRLAIALATAALLAIAVRLAWLGDDAFITLRSVENLVRGNGLRWNAADRVHVFTHPLWMLLLAAGRWVSGECYFTTIAIGLALTTAAVVIMLRRAGSAAAVTLAAVLMVTARAFPEYATSGLETPLVFLLLAVFTGCVATAREPNRRCAGVVLVAALLAMTRLDLVLLVAPAALAAMRGVPWGTAVGRGVLSASPLLGWLVFAWLYFGSPFPVTAHAKAFGVGIPAAELAAQGCYFLWHCIVDDPVLAATTGVGLLLGLCARTTRWLALGGVLYLGYVVKVGGDFMEGRFLLPPFVLVLAILIPQLQRLRTLAAAALAGVAVALAAAHGIPAWLQSPATEAAPVVTHEGARGIGDERAVYYWRFGLLARGRTIPVFGELHAQVRPEGGERPWLLLNGAVGVPGFQAGKLGHIVDAILCDPLLARLPARTPDRWRIGHVLRRIPEGYWETLATGENQLRHPGLAAYYDALRLLTRAPVFAPERLAAVWRMARGEFDAGLREFVAEHYYTPPRIAVATAQLPPPLPLGTHWFDEPRMHPVYEGGLAVAFAAPQSARTIRAQVSGMCAFRFRFVREGTARGEAMGVRQPLPANVTGLRAVAGLREELVAVPATVADYDTLWIDLVETPESHIATGPAAIGAVTPVP